MSLIETSPDAAPAETPAAADLVASPSQTVGPFFHFGLTTDASLGQLAGPGAAGDGGIGRARA